MMDFMEILRQHVAALKFLNNMEKIRIVLQLEHCFGYKEILSKIIDDFILKTNITYSCNKNSWFAYKCNSTIEQNFFIF